MGTTITHTYINIPMHIHTRTHIHTLSLLYIPVTSECSVASDFVRLFTCFCNSCFSEDTRASRACMFEILDSVAGSRLAGADD
jgi:hypothetical protein